MILPTPKLRGNNVDSLIGWQRFQPTALPIAWIRGHNIQSRGGNKLENENTTVSGKTLPSCTPSPHISHDNSRLNRQMMQHTPGKIRCSDRPRTKNRECTVSWQEEANGVRYNAQRTRHTTKVEPMINESSRGDTPGGELAPGPLDRIVRQNMPATVKLPLISSSQDHHVRPEDRGSRVPRHLPAARNAKLIRSGGRCCVDLTICGNAGSKHARTMLTMPPPPVPTPDHSTTLGL